MSIINQIFNTLFDLILSPFSKLNQFWGIFFISMLSGLLLIYIFKITSNQKAIKNVKNKIKAHIFEIRLFDLNPLGLLRVLGVILKHNLRYVSYSAIPLLFMIIPVLIILIQLNFRYGLRGHYPGESALLKIHLEDGINIMNVNSSLNLNEQGIIDIGPMRNIPLHYIAYQIKVSEPKNTPLDINLSYNGETYDISKLFNNTSSIRKYSNKKPSDKFLDTLLYPFEKPINNNIVKEIDISYPENRIGFLGIDFHYIIFFFIFSVVGGFLFKGVVGAEI